MYISSYDELVAFCTRLAHEQLIAVDTEFLREKTYYPKLCLIQVGSSSETAAIDPLLIDNLNPLKKLFYDRSIVKIFHACSQDLEVIYDALGCVPNPVFDTQVAAAFLGHRQQIGYGALVEDLCSVHLPKAESLTDWSRRPLDPEQLRYAEDDVRYLPEMYRQMTDELVRKDRLSWIRPEMEQLTNPDKFLRKPELAYVHLKRSGSLTRRQLGIAQHVCAWREKRAAKRNIPRKWVATDELLVELCKRTPRTVEQLRKIRGSENLSEADAISLCEAVSEGCALPETQLPEKKHRERPSLDQESVIDLMYAMLRLVAKKEGIAAQTIASREDLAELASGKDDAQLKQSWRYELVGKSLEGLLSGELGLTVKDGHVEVL